MFKIIDKIRLNEYTSKMIINAPDIANSAGVGQFVIIRVNETGERIPLTISNADKKSGYISIIYQKVGKTTFLLDSLEKGDFILNVVGPLGKKSELDGYLNSIIVGGGTGCAIAYPQAKYLFKNGSKVHIIAGFRNSSLIILENEMKDISHKLDIVTDDGSNGNKGLVTDILYNTLKEHKGIDVVVAVGPLKMMQAVCEVTKKFEIKTIVSMNSIMIDGTGMCGGCRLTVDGKVKLACVDGPDFDGHLVDFEEAILRSSVYTNEENLAKEKFCNMIKGCQ